jgi:separase
MMSRALAKKGEVLLHQGLLKEGHGSLMQATEVLRGTPGTDGADVRRLRGDYSQKTAKEEDAWQLYQEADSMLEELDQMFGTSDGLLSVYARSCSYLTGDLTDSQKVHWAVPHGQLSQGNTCSPINGGCLTSTK